MSKLKDLQLEIPSIDLLEARKLFGGGQYGPPHLNDSPKLPELPELPEYPDSQNIPDGIIDFIPPNPEDMHLDIPELDSDIIIPHIDFPDNDQNRDNDHLWGDREDDRDREDFDREGRDPDDFRDYDRDPDDDRTGGRGHGGGGGTGNTGEDPLEYLHSKLNDQQNQLIAKMGIKISIDPNLGKAGQYNPEDHSIKLLNNTQSSPLISELIHAFQQDLGILGGGNRSNNEFQEHVLTDIWSIYSDTGMGTVGNADNDPGQDYKNWLNEITHYGDVSQPFDIGCFYDYFEEYFKAFREQNAGDPNGYGDEPNDNYNWMWETFFNFLGIH